VPLSHPPQTNELRQAFSSCTFVSLPVCTPVFECDPVPAATFAQLRLSAASMIALACGVIEFPYADPLGQCQERAGQYLFIAGASSALHRDKSHRQITVPSQESDTRSLGEIGFFIAADMFPSSLHRTPACSVPRKISFGNGTTTSSTVVDNW